MMDDILSALNAFDDLLQSEWLQNANSSDSTEDMVMLGEANELFAVIEEFESVFREVSDEWTKACYETNFADFDNFSEAIHFSIVENLDIPHLLITLCGVLLRYEQSADQQEAIWERLAKMNMKAQKLVVFLWYLIERGLVPESALEEQKIGLGAASAYLALCSLTGSQAFNIFNPILYQKALDTLRGAYRLLMLDGFRGGDGRSRQGKPGRKRKADITSCALQHSATMQLTDDMKREVKEGLSDALDSFFVLLNKVSLSTSPEAGVSTACLVGDLMRIDFAENVSVSAKECRRLSEFQSLHRFSERSFALMHRLIQSRHTGVELVLPRIVMPRLLFWTFENTALPAGAHPTRLMNDYKEAMIRFLRIRIEKKNEEEMDFILRILENVCHRCPERSEYRSKVASTVCETLALMPNKYLYEFAHFIRIFGSIDRAAWRGFAVEIIPLMLQNFDLSGPDPAVQNGNVKEDEKENDQQRYNDVGGSEATRKVKREDDGNKEEDEEEEDVNRTAHEKRRQKKSKKRHANELPPVERLDPLVALFTLMVRSCNDKSSAVRARAIVQMTALLEDEKMCLMLSRISKQMAALETNEQQKDGNETAIISEQSTDSPLLNMLLNRCADSRVSVRKAAIMALEACFSSLIDANHINHAITAIKQGCRDASLLMRKQSAESLTRLLMSVGDHPEFASYLQSAWLSSVMPLVVDREQSVLQLASKLITETLISPILRDEQTIAWRLLTAVEQELDARRSILRAVLYEAKEGNLSSRVVEVLLKKCDQPDKASVVWMLLDDLSTVFKVDPSPAVRVWFSLAEDEPGDVISYVAHVIGMGAQRLKSIDRQTLREDLSSKLLDYRVNDRHIPKVYWAHWRLCDRDEEGSETGEFKVFNTEFIKRCCADIRDVVYGSERNFFLSQNTGELACRLVRIITSIGEIVQYDPSLITDSLSEMMQLIFASDVIGQQISQIESRRQTLMPTCTGCPNENTPANDLQIGSQPAIGPWQGTTIYPVVGSSRRATRNAVGPSQGTAATHGLTCSVLLQSYLPNCEVFTSSVRANAVLTIGKMCLVDEKLTKKCVPVFMKQLVDNPDHCVRNNILVVVCDLCIRYTLLVDRYSATIALSLRDRSTLVRKQALTLLTCLIKEQYIRWEGQIMYRIVSTLLDEDGGIREYAQKCLLDVLLVQFPKMFEHHFIECLFYFNRVEQGAWAVIKAMDNKTMSNLKKVTCSLVGENRREDRMKLYKFMLKTFNDESKFILMERIGHEVFLAVVDGSLDIKECAVQALLLDCYNVMCSKEIKLTMALGRPGPNAPEEDDDEPPAAVQAGARRAISQIFRRGIMEAILPPLIQLRYYVQNKGVADCHERGVLLILRELCKDHKEQLDEFMASDPLLKEEIRFDLKKLEERERAEAEARQRILTSIARSAHRSLMRSAGRSSSDMPAAGRTPLQSEKDGAHLSTPVGISCIPRTGHAMSVDRAAHPALVQRISGTAGSVSSGTVKNVRRPLPPVLHSRLPRLDEELYCLTLTPSSALAESRPVRGAIEVPTSEQQIVAEQIQGQHGPQRMEPISEHIENEEVVMAEAPAETMQICKTTDHSEDAGSIETKQNDIRASPSGVTTRAGRKDGKKRLHAKKVTSSSVRQEAINENPSSGAEITTGNPESLLERESRMSIEEMKPSTDGGEHESSDHGMKRPPVTCPADANAYLTPVSASRPRPKKKKVDMRDSTPPRTDNNDLNARAISTPTHPVDEVTFRLADVSAIVKSPSKRDHLRSTGNRVVETIEEDED